MYDPLRVQLLTLSLDSEAVLALVGVLLAGLVARDAARALGLPPDGWWDATLDVAFWTLLAARVGWALAHPQEYLTAPRQLLALADGGYSFAAGAIAAAWLVRRAGRRVAAGCGAFALVAAPAVAAALLLDRAGCALTACGVGQPTALPWALVRSGAAAHPVGLYGVALWAAALALLRGSWLRARPRWAWPAVLAVLCSERALAWGVGRDGWEGLAGAGALAAVTAFVSVLRGAGRPPAAVGLGGVAR